MKIKSELVQLVEEYELIRRIVDDLKAEKAELRIYSFRSEDWLEVGEILEGVDNKIANRLDAEVIDLRRQIIDILREDEKKQINRLEVATFGQLATDEEIRPKNDYRRQQNTQEDDDGK